ncbi:Tfp pilus assembly protein FimT/FimU [Phycisphaerales bacterium AB-hyl4]|uniref:Tfp pilus assembly protein FimT/FimU n=1 Tax=Natronomicrosphaera hydrolytica TaxID=3242702 RepID=A0ABV4U8S1_9BACT
MHMHTQPTRRSAGFTMMELIISIVLASLLAFLVNSLFFETSRAVQVGVRTGDMLVESESIGEQIRRDAERMAGPNKDDEDPTEYETHPPGVLVIVNRLFRYDEGYEGVRVNFEGTERLESIRSDQISFITRLNQDDDPFAPLTPQSDVQFHNENTAPHARVWYGHVLRTPSSGAPYANNDDAWLPNTDIANNWILGRQQLLLADGPDGTIAEHFTYDANVLEAATPTTEYPYSSPQPMLYHGLTDVADFPLFGTDSLIAYLEADPNDYGPRAAAMTFIRDANERLHVNPQPTDNDQYLASWQLAQMHAILAMGVSDFIVEFAGDYDSTSEGRIDRDADNRIKWYSYHFNNPDEGRNFPINWDEELNLSAYDYDAAIPRSYDATQIDNGYFQDLDGNDEDQFHFQHINSTNSYSTDNADAVFVFRHDNDDPDECKWPHLIRIRYRLHDHRGMVTSLTEGYNPPPLDRYEEYAISGRWFEHIIRVPRP